LGGLKAGGTFGWFDVAKQTTNHRGRTTMNDYTIIEFAGRDTVSDTLTDLLRKGARELLQTAVEAELDAFLTEFAKHRTPEGRAAVVRNGHHPERAVQTGIGPVTVQIPKVRSKTSAPVAFRSALIPPYVRKPRQRVGAGAAPRLDISATPALLFRDRSCVSRCFHVPNSTLT
jgi:hypothetical protein